MKRRNLSVFAAALLAPGTAWACGYNLGPGVAFVPYLMLWPVVAVLLALAYGFRRQTGWRRSLSRFGLAVSTIYVVLFALTYPHGMKPDGFSGREAILLSTVLFVTILGICLCVLESGRRRLAIAATVSAFVLVNLLTPRVVRFYDYQPVDNPLPEPDATMRILTSTDAELSDGRYLRFDRLDIHGRPLPVFLEELSAERVEVSVARTRRTSRRFAALIELGWVEIREEMNEIVTLGIGEVLSEDRAADPDAAARILFYSGCQPDAIADALRRGADPNATVLHSPALHFAAEKRCPSAVEALLAAGADVNGTNSSGETALHRAARAFGTQRVLEQLIAAGADPGRESRNGATALEIARARFGPGGSESWRAEAPAIVAVLEAAANERQLGR